MLVTPLLISNPVWSLELTCQLSSMSFASTALTVRSDGAAGAEIPGGPDCWVCVCDGEGPDCEVCVRDGEGPDREVCVRDGEGPECCWVCVRDGAGPDWEVCVRDGEVPGAAFSD